MLWYEAGELVIELEGEVNEIVMPLLEVVIEDEEAVELVAVVIIPDDDDNMPTVELVIGEERVIPVELIIGEELITAEELVADEELIINDDTGDADLADETDETAEVTVGEIMPDDAILIPTRLDVVAVDGIVELVARCVNEVSGNEVLVGALATIIPATKL